MKTLFLVKIIHRILIRTFRGKQCLHENASAETAARRGRPVILTIDAAAAYQHGHLFYRAANGTWLTSHLPPQWIITPSPSDNTCQ
jgi:RNA:NAD 2'-phosphotransferase (TPT1/KptA family)